MRTFFFILSIFTAWLGAVCAERAITLDEAIARARGQSVDAAVAVNELRTAYWEYRTFRAELLPEITFKATLPSFNKRYNSYQREDGSYTFLRDDNLMLSGSLTATQRIWLTGGTLELTSSLDFVRQLSNGVGNRFMSVPVALRLNQPLFAANDVKWNRRIEPVRYREAMANYLSQTEELAMQAINYFFNLLSARQDYAGAAQNVANAEKLYEAAKVKRSMGKISENDVLQIELNLLNSRSALTKGESNVRSAMFQLRSFLNLPDDEDLIPVEPAVADLPEVEYDDVISKALEYNSLALNIQRRQLEADYEVAKARGNLREVNLFAQVGYTGTNDTFKAAYNNLKGNQVVEVGISIPLLDWGKRKGKVKVARSRRDLTRERLNKERNDFCQNLFVLVERFNNQRQQLSLAIRAEQIATRRYDSSVETFLIGKLSTLDLNDSQENKDTARSNYLNEMFYYWYYYYQLRSLTLWDFEKNTPIETDFKTII